MRLKKHRLGRLNSIEPKKQDKRTMWINKAHLVFLLWPLFLSQMGQARAGGGADPNRIAAMKAAVPLNHTVTVSRTGRVLKLDYKLVGSDGKTYNLWDIRDRNKPEFFIYENGVKVGGGTFEYG